MEDMKIVLSTMDKYKTFLDDIRMGIYLWDLETDRFYPSKHLISMLGYSYFESSDDYNTWRKIWHPEDTPLIDAARKKAFANHDKEYYLLHRLKHHDGKYQWYRTDALIIYEDDKPKIIIGSTNDFEKIRKRFEAFEIEKTTYENYLQATEAGTWIWDIKSGKMTYDERWANMLGYTLKELEPTNVHTWESFVHPEDLERALRASEYALKNKVPYQTENRLRHKNGQYLWISDRGIVVSYDKEGNPLIMIGTHIDITPNKKLESELRANEYKYKQLVDSSYDVIYSLDNLGSVTFVSKAWYQLTGYKESDLIGTNFKAFIHEEDKKRIDGFFQILQKSKTRHELASCRLNHKNGSIIYFTTNAIAIRNESGELTGFAGTATDITEERFLQQKLSYEKDLFKKTLLSVADGVISTDSKGLITIINDSAQMLTGYKEKEAIGKPLEYIFKKEGVEKNAFEKNIKRIFIEGLYLKRKSGKLIPIESNISPILDEYGVEEGQVVVFRNISDKLKQAKDIEFLSYHDYLTGLYNRRYMENAIRNYDQKTFLPLGVLMLDVNDLKEMNDGYGHQAGDKLLQVVSQDILDNIYEDDIVGRIGGDEFMILSPNTSEDRMKDLKKKLLNAFSKQIIYNQKVQVAIGCSVKNRSSQSFHDIQKQADDLMYEHKLALRKKQ